MKANIIKMAIGLGWALILLIPMVASQISEQNQKFYFDWPRLWKIMAVLAISGVVVVLAGSFRKNKKKKKEKTQKPSLVSRIPRNWLWGGIAVVALAFPFVADNYSRDVIINVLIYVTLGLGLNMVVGLAGLLDLGYIAFYAVGAYTYALLNTHFGIPFWLSLPIGCVISAGAGAFIGYPTLKMRGDYLAIVTLGFGEIIRIVLNNWNGLTEGPNGILGIKAPTLYYPTMSGGDIGMGVYYMKNLVPLYFVILLITIVVIIAVNRIDKSRIGRAWVALREDETAAELTGIHTLRYKLLAYVIGAVVAGLAGAFFAAKVRYVNPSSFIFIESALVLCIVVLGGMGSIPGIMLGAAAIIVLPEVFRDLEVYRMLAFGGAMTFMMVFRPEGFIPGNRRKMELHGKETFGEEDENA